MNSAYSRSDIYNLLNTVLDPEVPVINVVELGIVRDVTVGDDVVRVDITPTYSGCPAMKVIEREIESVLRAAGVGEVMINTVHAPAWTTDWMTDEGRRKLKEYGIAPPGRLGKVSANPLETVNRTIPCPYCDSQNTKRTSEFGSTACKALYYCHNCIQPFEHFKCI